MNGRQTIRECERLADRAVLVVVLGAFAVVVRAMLTLSSRGALRSHLVVLAARMRTNSYISVTTGRGFNTGRV